MKTYFKQEMISPSQFFPSRYPLFGTGVNQYTVRDPSELKAMRDASTKSKMDKKEQGSPPIGTPVGIPVGIPVGTSPKHPPRSLNSINSLNSPTHSHDQKKGTVTTDIPDSAPFIFIFDTETTGACDRADFGPMHTQRPLEFGYAVGNSSCTLSDSADWFVKGAISDASDILWDGHGISFEMVNTQGIPVQDAVERLVDVMRQVDENNGYFSGANLKFDIRVIENTRRYLTNMDILADFYAILDRARQGNRYIDVLSDPRVLRFMNTRRYPKLQVLHDTLCKGAVVQTHRARGDCIMTLEVLEALVAHDVVALPR